MSQKKNLLHNKYFKAITWGSHESNWRIHLQELLRQEQQRVKEKNECLKMGHEEIANSKVERKIGTVLMFFMCGFIFLDNFLTLTSSFLWNNSDRNSGPCLGRSQSQQRSTHRGGNYLQRSHQVHGATAPVQDEVQPTAAPQWNQWCDEQFV